MAVYRWRMGLFPYHIRGILYGVFFFVILYTTVKIFTPNEIVISDRAAQRRQIMKDIENSKSGSWHGRQACKHPQLDVNSPEIMKFIKPQGPIQCTGEKDWVTIVGSNAVITNEAKSKYGDIECSFTDVLRTNDFTTHEGVTTTTHTEYNLEPSDFVRVHCATESGKRWNSVLSGIRHDQDVLDRTGWHLVPKDGLQLNVLMFGFDSLSRNTFIRKLPRSYNFIKDDLNGVTLEGYNIVGDGTPQALIPILTGKTELELPDTRRRMGAKAVHVNVYPFIWNDFRANGYVTAYMEDTPSVGIFTYRLKGFDEAPTDHYMRPYFVDAEPHFSHYSKLCIGSIPRHKAMLDYARHMYLVYKDRPKFIFGFHGELSHDSYNLIGAADDDLLEWLQWFKTEGHLNNTVLILMSDHGHRFAAIRNTQQGKLEERLPWFTLIFPSWFEHMYPEAMKNLRINARRLTTPFDIYATLNNILHYEGSMKGDLSQRSISLLKEIPEERTCADAYIEPHWCACLEWEIVDSRDSIVERAAVEFVNFINKYNAGYTDLCAPMKLDRILWSARLLPSKALRRFQQSADVDGFVPNMGASLDITMTTYQLKVTTLPGPALFEVSLTHYINQDNFKFRIEDISRINQYGSQASCIENTLEHLRKYCYCKKS